MAEVSVIVPVYNVEKYLSFCLDSIINQTLSDIEIICVNDGSTDNSELILKNYAAFDKRIKIINKENGGLSSARNTGVQAAQGEYIIFVDSDDYISPVLLEKVIAFSKKHKVDYVSFNYFSQLQNPPKTCLSFCAVEHSIENKSLLEKNIPDTIFSNIPISAWSKLYKTQIIKDYDMKFTEGMIYEDGPWTFEYFCHCKKLLFTNMPLYFYRVNREGSIMSQKDLSSLDIFKSLKLDDEVLKKYNKFEKYKNNILQLNLNFIIYYYNRLQPELREIYFYQAKEYFNSLDLYKYDKKQLEDSKYRKSLDLFLSCNFEAFEKAVKNG